MSYSGSKAQSGRGTQLSIGKVLSITGNTTSASTSVTSVSSTAGLVVGMPISGVGIPGGATIATIGSGTLTLSAAATATASAVALTVGSITRIGECDNFPLERGEWQTDDVTNFDSPADEEIITTIRKTGSVTLTGNRVSTDAGQVLVEAAYQSGALQSFTAVLPLEAGQTSAGDTVTFNAYVVGSSFKLEPTKAIKFSIKLTITGGTTLVEGS